MSVTSLDFQNQYTTDGVTSTYPFTWTCVNANEVTVYLNNVAQTIGTDFTVQLNPTGIGGTITFVSVPATSLALLIQRVDDFLQPNNFGNNQAIPPQTLVQMFDKLTIMCQQLLQQSALSLSLSLPAAAADVSGVLPFPIVPGALIGWDSAGTAPYYCVPVRAGNVIVDNGPGLQFTSEPATSASGGNVVGPTPPVVAGAPVVWADTSGRVLSTGANTSVQSFERLLGANTVISNPALGDLFTYTPGVIGTYFIIYQACISKIAGSEVDILLTVSGSGSVLNPIGARLATTVSVNEQTISCCGIVNIINVADIIHAQAATTDTTFTDAAAVDTGFTPGGATKLTLLKIA